LQWTTVNWHADDAGASGNFDEIRRFFHKLEEIDGPSFGHFLEPSKSSLLAVRQHKLEKPVRKHSQTLISRSRGFAREDSALREWIRENSKFWEEAVAALASAAPNFPRAAFTGLHKSLQQE
jgi:hypothetical protein